MNFTNPPLNLMELIGTGLSRRVSSVSFSHVVFYIRLDFIHGFPAVGEMGTILYQHRANPMQRGAFDSSGVIALKHFGCRRGTLGGEFHGVRSTPLAQHLGRIP